MLFAYVSLSTILVLILLSTILELDTHLSAFWKYVWKLIRKWMKLKTIFICFLLWSCIMHVMFSWYSWRWKKKSVTSSAISRDVMLFYIFYLSKQPNKLEMHGWYAHLHFETEYDIKTWYIFPPVCTCIANLDFSLPVLLINMIVDTSSFYEKQGSISWLCWLKSFPFWCSPF